MDDVKNENQFAMEELKDRLKKEKNQVQLIRKNVKKTIVKKT